MSGAMEGLTVVDVTQGLCGPFASLLMAEAGAEILKIEPITGDYGRRYGPPFAAGEGAAFLHLNRGKKSVALNVGSREGSEALRRLLLRADVFLEDLGPGRAEGMGLGHRELQKINPPLVCCAISPFGEQGPLRDMPGAELVIQAMSDYCNSLGTPGEPPERLGADVANLNTAVFAFDGVLAAVYHRLRTGEGQRVAVSMLGTLLHMRGIMWAAQSDPDEWYGFHCDSYTNPPDHGYQTQDRHVYFNLRRADELSWINILTELGLTQVLDDPRFERGGREAVGTGRYAPEVKHIWEHAFRDRTADEIMALMRRNTAEVVPLNDYQSLFAHPQVKTLDILQQVEHPRAGRFNTLAAPWRMGNETPTLLGPAPLLGQHTQQVLSTVGYKDGDLRSLARQTMIVMADNLPAGLR